jgi:pimeloyl-ACP methyl ester carboxylesterase
VTFAGRWRLSACSALSIAAMLAAGATVAAPSVPGGADLGGLHVVCAGERSAAPTVILQAGAFGTSSDWDLVVGDLAAGGRVCAYDRGGTGRSAPRPGGEDVVSIAHELWGLLENLGETAPVILVGHSNGALYAETFAAMWPERVAGLVYVNGVGSDDLDSPTLLGELAEERRLSDLAVVAAHLGLASLVAGTLIGDEGFSDDAVERKREALTSLPSLRVARDEDRAIVAGLSIPRELGGPPASVPVTVIVGVQDPNSASSRAWRLAEVAPATRSKRSWVLDAVGATHVSPLARDRTYIAAAVAWLRSLPGPDIGH